MKTATTEGINITVNTKYRADLSNVLESQFFFNYMIEIKNENQLSIEIHMKLCELEWHLMQREEGDNSLP